MHELDEELLAWLLRHLRAQRAAVFFRRRDQVKVRSCFGFENDPPQAVEVLASRTIFSEHGHQQKTELCIPLKNDEGRVVGALFVDHPLEPQGFSQEEIRFCFRCARWWELRRLGRATSAKPEFLVEEVAEKVEAGLVSERPSRLSQPLVFFRSLATMVGSGISLFAALEFLEASFIGGDRKVCGELAQQVSQGARLSQAMSGRFESHLVGLIRVAERTGALVGALEMAAEHVERNQRLRAHLKSTLTYPLLLATGALIMLLVAPAWLLEGHLVMLRQSGTALPWATQVLAGWSAFCRSPLLLPVLVLSGMTAWQTLRRPDVRRAFRRRARYWPGVGKVVRLYASVRFARTLSIGLKAGLNVLEALPLCGQTSGDPEIEELVEEARERLMAGQTLSGSLDVGGVFERGFLQLVAVGESSGRTPQMLEYCADFDERELNLALEQMLTLLEPLLLLGIGVFTAFVLVATMQPTLTLISSF